MRSHSCIAALDLSARQLSASAMTEQSDGVTSVGTLQAPHNAKMQPRRPRPGPTPLVGFRKFEETNELYPIQLQIFQYTAFSDRLLQRCLIHLALHNVHIRSALQDLTAGTSARDCRNHTQWVTSPLQERRRGSYVWLHPWFGSAMACQARSKILLS
jgi:hypothetical protein